MLSGFSHAGTFHYKRQGRSRGGGPMGFSLPNHDPKDQKDRHNRDREKKKKKKPRVDYKLAQKIYRNNNSI